MDAIEDQPVLSEVHMETCPPNTSAWSTRFCYCLSDEPTSSDTVDDQEHLISHAPAASPKIQHTPAAVAAAGSTCHTQAADSNDTAGDKAAGVSVDNDGDLVLPSRPLRRSHYITVHHSLATPVSRCGEQVWLGACLLCDWLLHNRQLLEGQTVVELGAGVGLASILAAQYARQVFLTDGDPGALQLASKNVAANAEQQQPEHLCSSSSSSSRSKQQGKVAVRQLDWLQLFDTKLKQLTDAEVLELLNSNSSSTSSSVDRSTTSDAGAAARPHTPQVPSTAFTDRHQPQQQHEQGSYAWSAADLPCLASAGIWLAADVVYNETITDAFMRTAYQLVCWQHKQQLQLQCDSHSALMPGAAPRHDESASASWHVDLPRLYVAVEKRYNFTYRDLDARASAYEHLVTYLQTQPSGSKQQTGVPCQLRQQQQSEPLQQRQQVQAAYTCGAQPGLQHSSSQPLFEGKRLHVASLPQAMVYDRSSDLELWELVPLLHDE